jgi:hypothetical protein
MTTTPRWREKNSDPADSLERIIRARDARLAGGVIDAGDLAPQHGSRLRDRLERFRHPVENRSDLGTSWTASQRTAAGNTRSPIKVRGGDAEACGRLFDTAMRPGPS